MVVLSRLIPEGDKDASHDATGRAALDPEEPDYSQAAQLGSDALPHIEEILDEPDSMLASKATYLASLIQGKQSETILLKATKSSYPAVRAAAAAGARNLIPLEASNVSLDLLEDRDAGVRKIALKSAPAEATPALREKIEQLKTTDPENFIRDLSNRVLID